MASMTMAELLAKQDTKQIKLTRGDAVEGVIISDLSQEIIIDLGSKAEGILPKKDLSGEALEGIQVGQKIVVYVISPETPSGQVLVSLYAARKQDQRINPKWNKVLDALHSGQTLTGKVSELNKGGLIIELSGVRGFVPFSQVAASLMANLQDLVGKTLSLKVIEVDPSQNRLILAQKISLSPEAKLALSVLKPGDKVNAQVVSVMSFGVFVSLENDLDGTIHISELSWEKVEDPTNLYKTGDKLEAQVLSVDPEAGKVNLSLKALQEDPFAGLGEKYTQDDVVKGKVNSVTTHGVIIELEPGIEAIMPKDVLEQGKQYQIGEALTVLIDKVDLERRRITVSPMLTTTSGLIYK